ncbi:hypothetical protein, partial [Streptomyces torulosus]|uniref:hypothetical protein n=1 Tax=Streptomyces torulosus TaxID=68276 RepID=UPI0006EB4FAE
MGELFIEQLLRDDLHAVVPSVGIDFLPVLQNCLDARRRRQSRDIKLLAVALCGALLSLALIGFGALPLVPFPVSGMLVVAYCVVHKDLIARQRTVLRLTRHRPSDPHRRRAGDWAAA